MAIIGQRNLLALAMVLATGLSAAQADWSYDFDGPAPADWTVSAITEPPGGTSATASGTIESGYLRLQDTTTAAAGGAFSGFAGVTSDVFTDVSVSAIVNPAKDTDDDLGVVVRTDPNAGNTYFGSVDYEQGSACITKVKAFSQGVDMACSPLGSLSMTDSHYITMTAVGADLSLSVYDGPGGTLLQTVNATDDGTIPEFGGVYPAGISGVFIVPKGTTIEDASANVINGTFDNVSSTAVVPEPATGMMALFSILGLIGFRRRSR